MQDTHQASQQNAISFSNYGVSLVEAGQYDASIPALSKALKTCRQIMDEADDFPAPIATSLDACMESSREASPLREEFQSYSEEYLYRQAARIPLDVGTNYRACVMVSTMVTFNLALANQLAAMGKVEQESQTMLRKAAKLYELAFSMQQEEDFDCNTLFTLATVNNLGLIHSQLNDRTAANKCFEYLLSTLMYLTDCSGQVAGEFDGFFRNASTLIHKHESAPAA